MTNEDNKSLNKVISDYQREMFDKGGFYQSEMAQYLIQLSFEKCAQWKDEQFAKEKQTLINKVCEWLKNNVNSFLRSHGPEGYVFVERGQLLDNLRKAMEK